MDVRAPCPQTQATDEGINETLRAFAERAALRRAELTRTTDERAKREAFHDYKLRMINTQISLTNTGSRIIAVLMQRGEATVRLRPLPLVFP